MLKKFMQPTVSPRMATPTYPPVSEREKNIPEPEVAAPKPAPREEGSKLIVGPNIKLKGSEITDCDILVVEGRVEASMNSRVIQIADGGVFAGKAEIDVAEIHGRFEGELTARKRLVIHATGKVTGTIRYGAITVEEGGMVAGDVAALGQAETKAEPTASRAAEGSNPGETKPDSIPQIASLARPSMGVRAAGRDA